MSTSLYVGNLPYAVSESDLSGLFTPFGRVEEVRIITDPATGRSKGYAFVTLATRSDAEKALRRLNGKDFRGRNLKVGEARRKKEQQVSERKRKTGPPSRPAVRFPSDWNTWKKTGFNR